MDLFLFRHAAAVAFTDPATDDDARALTPRGRRRFHRLVAALDRRKVRFDRVLHSPRLRAIQTAELLHPLLRGEAEVCAELIAAPGPELLARLTGERLAVVGHEPWLGDLVGMLVGAPDTLVDWRKGGLVWLVGSPEPGKMRIRAVLPIRLAV